VAKADDADSQGWLQINIAKRYPNGFRFIAEVQPRLGLNYSRLTQLLLRPTIGYNVTKTTSFWVGYGWTPTFAPQFNDENHVFQQVMVETKLGNMDVVNRFRFEERRIEGAGDTAVRGRYMLRFMKPIRAKSKWSLVGWDELFWNMNSTMGGPEAGLDQNRSFIGLSYTANKHIRYEFGYMKIFQDAPRSRPDRHLDVFMLQLNYNL
jgi:hypothetical protein